MVEPITGVDHVRVSTGSPSAKVHDCAMIPKTPSKNIIIFTIAKDPNTPKRYFL
jgi:hypothetical protein